MEKEEELVEKSIYKKMAEIGEEYFYKPYYRNMKFEATRARKYREAFDKTYQEYVASGKMEWGFDKSGFLDPREDTIKKQFEKTRDQYLILRSDGLKKTFMLQ